MIDQPRAIQYANPWTCWAYRAQRTLEPLAWKMNHRNGEERWLLPDHVVLYVGSDMSVQMECLDGAVVPINCYVEPLMEDNKVMKLHGPLNQNKETWVYPKNVVAKLAPKLELDVYPRQPYGLCEDP